MKSTLIQFAFFLSSSVCLAQSAPYITVVEHESCNEIHVNQDSGHLWREQSSGGTNNVNDFSYKSLNNNLLDEIHFGRSAQVSFKFNGKQFVPDAISPDQNFGLEVQALLEEQSDSIVGKFIGFTDANPETRLIPDKTAQFGSRWRLSMAVMYVNPSLESVPLVVPCDYVVGDLTPVLLQSGRCLWVDQHSRPSNGKPYCW